MKCFVFTNVLLYKDCRQVVIWNKNFNLLGGKVAEKDQRQKRTMPISSELLYLNSEEMGAFSATVEHFYSMSEELDSIFSVFNQVKIEET